MATLSDESIIALYFDRNEQAIEATNGKYGAYCNQIAYRILCDAQSSEECVNDTWLKAWNAIPPERPRILRAFLAKITRNLSLNRYQAMQAEKRGGGETAAVLDELAEIVSGGGDPADEVLLQELGQEINAFLRALPETERNLMIRRYFYGEAVSEAAAQLGLTPGNASVMLNRCRGKLKKHLTEKGYFG